MPPRKPVSDFMVSLAKRLIDSREIAETTANAYIEQLKQLNKGLSYSNLGFLKKRDTIMVKIGQYAESTQKSVLGVLVSVLSLEKDKPTYKSVYNFYYERMMEASKKAKNTDTAVKTDKQAANWITWDEVVKRHGELAEAVKGLVKSKLISSSGWYVLLGYVLLSLYVLLPPRRNQDYQDLYVVKHWSDKLAKDKNYYDATAHKFVFNKYKTSKTHGAQEIDISDNKPLLDVITTYLKLHPSKSKSEYKFLVGADGSALSSVNSITRVLNKVFGKQIGSSMLRHIYLSSKYNIEEMKKDADAMGHTLGVQKEYLKE
jgi:hypothetical protein